MRIVTLIALTGLVAVHAPAEPLQLPEQLTYLVFASGKPAGRTAVTIYAEGGSMVFESETEMDTGTYEHSLSCRTEIDPETFRPLLFTYNGRMNHIPVSGRIWTRGDSIFGETLEAQERDPSFMWSNMFVLFVQDYIVEHQIVTANAIAAEGGLYRRFMVLLPSDFQNLLSIGALESELAFETPQGSLVCKKYRVTYAGRGAYFVYFDAKRRLPVYIEYPEGLVEFFLVDAFGPRPTPKYQWTKPQGSR